ncbi:hypothetical protein M0R45_027891 [Rubus argutus]|uniref:KRR-R motif-containing protein 1 n=1 Tax=Rubus argutus TaxID=59490 RepID=A0AAW1W3G3_RUBAR
MEHKENGFVEQHDPKVDPAEETAPLLNGDGMPDVISFSRRFPRIIESDVQKAWLVAKSAFDYYGISCTLDLVNCLMTISKPRTRDSDIIFKAKDLLELLAMNIPVSRSIYIMEGRKFDIIENGSQRRGLCAKFGITSEQFRERRRLLLKGPALKALGKLTSSDIFVGDGIVVSLGDSYLGMKLVRRMVEDCILHKVTLASRIASITRTRTDMTSDNLEDLRL